MIKDLLPKKSKHTQLIQAQVDKDLLNEIMKLKKQTGWTWEEIITACLSNLLVEMRGAKCSAIKK